MSPLILARLAYMSQYERNFAAKHFRLEESRVACRDALVVGRYSVLPFYEELDRDLRLVGSRLVNSAEEHRWISEFAYYQELKDFTPETWDENSFLFCDYDGPFVVRGKRGSKKWRWKSLMFAHTKRQAVKLGERLKEDAEISEQGIIYRRYVPLKTFEVGKDGLPYTNEWRFYYFRTTLLEVGYYWSAGDCFRQAAISEECKALAQRIAETASKFTAFFTLDMAETQGGDWILIEINDAQMAAPVEHDLDALYGNLRNALTEYSS